MKPLFAMPLFVPSNFFTFSRSSEISGYDLVSQSRSCIQETSRTLGHIAWKVTALLMSLLMAGT